MSELSPSLDFVVAGRKNILYSLILDRIKDNTNLKILDVGCKDGEDLLYLINKKPQIQVYGLDIAFFENWTNDRSANCHFINGNGIYLPFKDSCLDMLMTAEIIEHFADVNKFLAETYRVLKPEGYFFITTPLRYNYPFLIGKLVPKRFKNSLRKLVYPGISPKSGIKEILPDGTIIKEHVHEYLPGEFKKVLKKNGFSVDIIKAGDLHVPVAPLFDRFPLLLSLWKLFDKVISKCPLSIYIKANFIVRAKKIQLQLN